jgi:uncharacterized protein (DUF488 family)
MKLFTIGHSNHTIDQFMQLLIKYGIEQVVDVRSAPYSRYVKEYNRDYLESYLKNRQLLYKYEGKDLGGRPTDPSCYKKHKLPAEGTDYLHEVDYPEVMRKPWFEKGIERLMALAEERVTTILCSEEDPADCHRHHMIALYLADFYPEVEVLHIRKDGVLNKVRDVRKSVNDQQGEQLSLF